MAATCSHGQVDLLGFKRSIRKGAWLLVPHKLVPLFQKLLVCWNFPTQPKLYGDGSEEENRNDSFLSTPPNANIQINEL